MSIGVWFVVLPGVLSLDLTGPAETLALAGEAFHLRFIGPDPQVTTSIGLSFGDIEPLPERFPTGSLLVLPGVCDSNRYFNTPQAEAVRRWLTRLQPQIHSQQLNLVCVCSGSLLAAKAGLMNGVQCTTHHDVLARLRAAAPTAQVKDNRIFVEDQGIWTSAGITSGIDLSLHLINRYCGLRLPSSVYCRAAAWSRPPWRRVFPRHVSSTGPAPVTLSSQACGYPCAVIPSTAINCRQALHRKSTEYPTRASWLTGSHACAGNELSARENHKFPASDAR